MSPTLRPGSVPSGKRLHTYGKKHHFSWVNQRFLWPFSSSQTVSLPEGKSQEIPINPIKSH